MLKGFPPMFSLLPQVSLAKFDLASDENFEEEEEKSESDMYKAKHLTSTN
jgi:hypothetical protein